MGWRDNGVEFTLGCRGLGIFGINIIIISLSRFTSDRKFRRGIWVNYYAGFELVCIQQIMSKGGMDMGLGRRMWWSEHAVVSSYLDDMMEG